MRRVDPIKRASPLRIYVVFFYILITWQPGKPALTGYRDNSVKWFGNSHVIAFCRVGSATRVELLSDGSLYSVINT